MSVQVTMPSLIPNFATPTRVQTLSKRLYSLNTWHAIVTLSTPDYIKILLLIHCLMRLLIALGCERTMFRSAMVRVLFAMRGMSLQWQNWDIIMCNYCGMFYWRIVRVYTTDSRCTCAGSWSWYCCKNGLASLCTNLRQSEIYLRQFTIADCRGLFLSMLKNNLRPWKSSALICSHTRSYKSHTDPACIPVESYLHSSALICTSRSTDWLRLT